MKYLTYAESKTRLINTLKEHVELMTFKEAFLHIYHWYMYEKGIRKNLKIRRKISYHSKKLNHDMQVFKLRKNMKDL